MKRGQISYGRNFPGGPAVGTLHVDCRGMGLIPGWVTKIPQGRWQGKKKKKDKLLDISIGDNRKYILAYMEREKLRDMLMLY